MELIPLTARMVMTHLVNHLGHHPLSGGPALLHSLISENHDNLYVESSELSSEVFKSPNLQLFVFNDSTLVSCLQIPPAGEGPSEPRPGPTTLPEVRVIVRDISGKYSWDGGVLYRPLEGGAPLRGGGLTTRPLDPGANRIPDEPPQPSRCVPADGEDGEDALDRLLDSLGHSSPECLPQPRLQLNQPAPSPFGMNPEQEAAITEAMLRQTLLEEEHVRRWCGTPSARAPPQNEPEPQEPKAPFYFCRLLLNDLGMNSWDRR